MTDPDAFAALLCDWCLEVRQGEQVLVAATEPSLPLALACTAPCCSAGRGR